MWPNSNRVGVCESYRKLEKNVITNRRSTPRRCPSPNASRTITKTPLPISTRAVSTERRRPVTPQSPSSPTTPVHDTSVGVHLESRKAAVGGKPDSLWPSRMRSLHVSFQSDTFSVSGGEREKKPNKALFDRALKSSSNESQKRCVTPLGCKKGTPERQRSPLKGKNAINAVNQTENRLPNRTSCKLSTTDIDPNVKPMKTVSAPNRNVRMQIEKSASDPFSVRLLSSNKPSQTRPVSPGHSRIRPSSPLRQPCCSTKVSVLTFVADIKKGKKLVDQIEDAHYLRLLHNRQIQLRFANAATDAVMKSQNVTAKDCLFNVWRSTSELRGLVAEKRIELERLRLKLKLYSVLNQQLDYINGWDSIENEYTLALSDAIDDLQSSTLRLPATEGATVNTETLKSSFCSAIHVMQTIGSSLQSTLSKGPNCMANELANVAAQERALLDECKLLLATVESLQEKEHSLRTHLVQLKQKS